MSANFGTWLGNNPINFDETFDNISGFHVSSVESKEVDLTKLAALCRKVGQEMTKLNPSYRHTAML